MEHENALANRNEPSFTNPISSQASLLGRDRISTLPDSVVHHIYNFLPTRVVAQTSTLSKRFDKLWLSYPVLELNDVHHYKYFVDIQIMDELSLSANKPKELLSVRVKQFNRRYDMPRLEKLKISVTRENVYTGYDEDLPSAIDDLIYIVAEAGTLKEIDLRFRVLEETFQYSNSFDDNPFEHTERFYRLQIAPICSWCKSLKHLKLVGCMFGDTSLPSHQGVTFPSLKTLRIKLCIVGGPSITDLISSCPELEKLSFKYCSISVTGTLRFVSPKLKSFVLGCSEASMVVDVTAPSLERFKFVGKSVEGLVGVEFMAHHVVLAPNLQNLIFKGTRLDNKGIRKALSRYKNLKELQVKCCSFKDKPNFGGKKLEKLEVSYSWFGTKSLKICASRFPALKSLFINACPYLMSLVIECPDLAVRVEGCHYLSELSIST